MPLDADEMHFKTLAAASGVVEGWVNFIRRMAHRHSFGNKKKAT